MKSGYSVIVDPARVKIANVLQISGSESVVRASDSFARTNPPERFAAAHEHPNGAACLSSHAPTSVVKISLIASIPISLT